MGLFIEIERIYRFGRWPDTLKEKLRLALSIMNFFKDVIVPPIMIKGYYDAMIPLGTNEIRSYSAKSLENAFLNVKALFDRVRREHWPDIFRLEILLEFGLNLEETPLDAYLAIHNSPRWRAAYGDIEFDLYDTGKYESFVDFIEKTRRFEIIDSLLRHIETQDALLRENKLIKIKRAILGRTPEALDNISDAVAMYSRSEGTFLSYIMKTVKYHAEVLNEPFYMNLYESFRPIKQQIVTSRMLHHKGFRSDLIKMAKEAQVEMTSGSLILIGKERDSLNMLFEKISRKYLKKIAERGIKIKYSEIVENINKALEEAFLEKETA